MTKNLRALALLVAFGASSAQAALCFSLSVAGDDPAQWPAPYTIIVAPRAEGTSPDELQTVKIALNPAILRAKPYGYITKVELVTFKTPDSESRKKATLIKPPQGMLPRNRPYTAPTIEERRQMYFRSTIEGSRHIEIHAQPIALEMSVEEFNRTAIVIDQAVGKCPAGSLAFFLVDTPVLSVAPPPEKSESPK